MERSGKVSVIIPLYNGEQYIEETVGHVLGSDHTNIEVIIVDDGSTDNSYGICDRLRQTDARIRLYGKQNGGVVSARNYGVSVAAGEYLCFCDQDDIPDSRCYAAQVERMELEQSDICMCSVARSIGGKISAFELSEDACYEGTEILEQLVYPILFNGFDVPVRMGERKRYPQIWSCMFRMSFWRKHNFQFRAYVSYEDDLLVKVQAMASAERVSTLSAIGYYWRINLASESYVHRYIEDIMEKQQQCYEDLYTSIAGRVDDDKVLGWFKKVTYCRQYLEVIHNIAGSEVKKGREAICDAYHADIYSRCFEECIAASRYVKRGTIKPRVILSLLNGKHTMLCHYMDKILDHILMLTLHSHVLTRMERMLKKIK